MSEKIKVTKKQAEIIEKIKETGFFNTKLSQALEHGYEVVPEFHYGDWVVGTAPEMEMYRPEKVVWAGDYSVATEKFQHVGNDCIRHATESEIKQEKERRFWDKLGRKIGEYHHYDIAFDDVNLVHVEVDDPDAYAGGHARVANLDDKSDYRGIDPVYLTLVCPAENRLDVNTND